jgi:hypothetical protein
MKLKSPSEQILISSLSLQIVLYIASLLGVGYPLIEFLFTGRGAYGDFIDGLILTPIYYHPDLGQDGSFSQPNAPMTILLYRALRFFFPSLAVTNWASVNWVPVLTLLIFFLIIIVLLLRKVSVSTVTSIVLTFSYPMLFLFGRANPDIFCLILFLAFILSFNSKKFFLCAIIIAIIGSIKLPFFFISLSFIFVKKLNVFIGSVILLPIFFFLPLVWFEHPFLSQVNSLQRVAQNYHRDYVLGEAGSMFNNSFYGLLKIINYTLIDNKSPNAGELLIINESIVQLHNFMVVLVLAIFVFMVKKLEIVNTNKNLSRDQLLRLILILTSLSILLPYISADYRLTFLLPPIAALLADRKLDTVSAILVGLLFLPKSFYSFEFNSQFMGTHFFSSALNPIILSFIVITQFRVLMTMKNNSTPLGFKAKK